MGKGVILLAICMLICINIVAAATITGSVYGPDLDELNNVIVKINTQPMQQFIVKEGVYTFNVPAGEYSLEAKYYEQKSVKYEATEKLIVKQEGVYNMDLLLFPPFEDDTAPYPDLDLNVEDIELDEKNSSFVVYYILGIVLVIVVGVVIYLIARKKKGKNKEPTEETKKLEQEITTEGEQYYNKVLEMIKQHKRITQKDIRKEIPLSEAKISLIISELESKGVIKKLKKGRGNIIILQ